MARAYSGCEVWQQDFLKLDLPDNRFDGVFANAALFHVPSQELPRVLLELHATLKPRGVLFSSNPHGHNEEGWNWRALRRVSRSRNLASLHAAAGFVELDSLLPPCRPAARTATVARERVAQVVSPCRTAVRLAFRRVLAVGRNINRRDHRFYIRVVGEPEFLLMSAVSR